MTRKLFPLTLVWAAAFALQTGGAAAKVGIASVVEGEPTGLPPGGTERILHVGIDMSADEKVTTKANDRTHLVFLDGTSLTVGPNSVMLIDKYVYDPEKKDGEMALKVERGTVRFVGGIISKKKEVTVSTPSAVMAIRGGILTVAVSSTGATTANFLFGTSFSITSENVTRTTTQTGLQITVTPGLPPSEPTPIPPNSLSTNIASFQESGPPPGPTGPTGPGTPTGGTQGGGRPSNTIGLALSNLGFGKINSGLSPTAVIAATPPPQQTTAFLTAPPGSRPGGSLAGSQVATQGGGQQDSGGLQPGSGPFQRGGPFQGGGPLQGAGPLLGAGPLQGVGPLLGAGPLQAAGPLLGAGPQQGSIGALSGIGPVAGANPLLAGGPEGNTGPVNINVPTPPPGPPPIILVSIPPQQLLPPPPTTTDFGTPPPPSPPPTNTPTPQNPPQTSNPPGGDPPGPTNNPNPNPFPPPITPPPTPPPQNIPTVNNVPPQGNGTPN